MAEMKTVTFYSVVCNVLSETYMRFFAKISRSGPFSDFLFYRLIRVTWFVFLLYVRGMLFFFLGFVCQLFIGFSIFRNMVVINLVH